MAVDMHTQTPLPRAPPSAKPVRSKPRIGGVVFQFLSTLIMLNGFKGLEHVDIPSELKVVDFSRFLTNWGLFLAIITTSLGTLSDLLPGISLIRQVKRAVLLIAFPLGITISTIYWSLILLAPSLILPTSSSPSSSGEPSSSTQTPQLFRIPLWIDLSLHAVPAVVLGIEFFLREKKFKPPVSTSGAMLLSSMFAAGYAGYIETMALGDNKFPYPFLRADQPILRAGIYVVSTGFAYLAFKVLNGLHR